MLIPLGAFPESPILPAGALMSMVIVTLTRPSTNFSTIISSAAFATSSLAVKSWLFGVSTLFVGIWVFDILALVLLRAVFELLHFKSFEDFLIILGLVEDDELRTPSMVVEVDVKEACEFVGLRDIGVF